MKHISLTITNDILTHIINLSFNSIDDIRPQLKRFMSWTNKHTHSKFTIKEVTIDKSINYTAEELLDTWNIVEMELVAEKYGL